MIMKRVVQSFLLAGGIWLAAGGLLCGVLGGGGNRIREIEVFGLFTGICLLDLWTLGKLFSALFPLVTGGEKLGFNAIQAFYWGTLKLACVGILIILLVKGESIPGGIPRVGMLVGLGTLIGVPLLGGIFWNLSES
jgi:uncharacterized membrane protein